MSKFGLAQVQVPCFKIITHKTAEEISQGAVYDLGLAIRLRMVGAAEQQLSIGQLP